jgi:hypothetical protein
MASDWLRSRADRIGAAAGAYEVIEDRFGGQLRPSSAGALPSPMAGPPLPSVRSSLAPASLSGPPLDPGPDPDEPDEDDEEDDDDEPDPDKLPDPSGPSGTAPPAQDHGARTSINGRATLGASEGMRIRPDSLAGGGPPSLLASR